MLPLWQMPIWPCTQSMTIGWALRQLAVAGGGVAGVADGDVAGQLRQGRLVEDVRDVAHLPRPGGHACRRQTAMPALSWPRCCSA